MYEFSLATALNHPLGQLVVTVIVAAVTSVLTVRIMGASGDAPKAPRRAPAAAPARDDTAIVAAISAAVYAVIGAHRIVYLAETRRGSSWTSEMRTQHHTSHTPHH
jgi:hypothetical protein